MQLDYREGVERDFWTFTALPEEAEAIDRYFVENNIADPGFCGRRSGVICAYRNLTPDLAARLLAYVAAQ